MSDKPLMDYTLAEVKEICKARTDCRGCIFERKDIFGCFVQDATPADWRVHAITKDEQDLLRLTGAKFISRDWNSEEVVFWEDKPTCIDVQWGNEFANSTRIGSLSASYFPSIKSGECLDVSKLLGEGEQTDG